MVILLSFVFLLLVLFIWCAVEAHGEEVTYARLKHRPSNVEMNCTDTKLAEFKKGDKGKVLDTEEVIRTINGYPNKYFCVIFENGKKLLVHPSCIKWLSYIDDENTKDTDKLEYVV